MYVLILPVSGCGFPKQLAILQHLCEAQCVPDITLASSGGNVAAFVAAAAKWTWPGIERISRELSSNLFSSSWANFSALSYVIGYFKGTIYNHGTGVTDFLHRYFTPETITTYEIWTGTYNKQNQKACLFCNRDQSILDLSCIDHDLTQSMPPVFNNGDINKIAYSGIASASIPATVPPQSIDNEDYIDGGIAGASPLAILREPILKYVNDTSLHLIYVNSIDLSKPQTITCHNVVDTFNQTAKNIVRTQTVIDRLAAYELFRCHPGTMHKEEFACNFENMKRIKCLKEKINFSMLEIYPTNSDEIDITNFTGDDVVNLIRNTYNSCRCRFWWLTPDHLSNINDICTLILQCKEGSV